MELGIGPADFGQFGSLEYSLSNGLYQAINTSDPLIPFLSATAPEADAMVLTGLVNGKKTLAITFRGTDQIADFGDYLNFATHYSKYQPLITAIHNYLNDP